MSQIISQLATIDISDEILNQFNFQNIYQSFSEKYRKLDDLKKFRDEYEEKNAIMRWWHNDKLRDAQLDSVEMQAEFSKTIGQLMMLSIMQSKRLTEQQAQLNEQQKNLQSQANGISEQADTLQRQHVKLAEQSHQLENLVRDYFALRGLTEEGAKKLVAIADEVRITKDGMLLEFDHYSEIIEKKLTQALKCLDDFSSESNIRLQQVEEQNLQAIKHTQQRVFEALGVHETNQKQLLENTLCTLNQSLDALARAQNNAEAQRQVQYAKLEANFFAFENFSKQQFSEQQKQVQTLEHQAELLSSKVSSLANELSNAKNDLHSYKQQNQKQEQLITALQQTLNQSLSRQRFLAAGLSISTLGLLGVVAYLVKLI